MTNKEKLQDYSLRIDNVTERIKELTLEKQYYKDNCVLYIAQTKTDAEKEIARQNINAQIAGDYILKSDFDTSLNSYVTKTELSTDLADYVTKTELATDLKNYTTKTELTAQLTSYVTKNSLKDSLNLYVTDEDLTSTLQSYTTTSALNAALKTKQDVGNYATVENLTNGTIEVKRSSLLTGEDSRNESLKPSDFYGYNYRAFLKTDFKNNSVLGNPFSSGTYCTLLTITPWTDPSGGRPTQMVFSDGKISVRGAPSDESWGDWEKIITSSNFSYDSSTKTLTITV